MSLLKNSGIYGQIMETILAFIIREQAPHILSILCIILVSQEMANEG